MQVNDLSLERGGAFDIGGRWSFDVVPPFCELPGHGHCLHRTGLSVDLGKSGDPMMLDHLDLLVLAMGKNGWRFRDEGQLDPGNPSAKFPHFDYYGVP